MSEKKRRWFQIHLSTIVVLTISAGGLLGLNLRPSERGITDAAIWVHRAQGWPIFFWIAYDRKESRLLEEWRNAYLAADVAIALAILGAIAFCCEWQIRRRKREKNE